MPPPVAVYVVAAVVSVAAVFAFKEFVYEPHIAPRFEAWAEEFLERRRASRNRRAGAVPVSSSRRRRDLSSPSNASHHDSDAPGGHGAPNRTPVVDHLPVGEFELELLGTKEVDEWRNEVLRSQERTRDGLRRRRMNRPRDGFDSFDTTNTTLDESVTSLTHTPLAFVISNISSPVMSTASLPQTPTRRPRSASQVTTTPGDRSTIFVAPQSPPSPIPDSPAVLPRTPFPASVDHGDHMSHLDLTSPSPLAIPGDVNHTPASAYALPLPFTPTYQIMAADWPFGPLLPDTPHSSAEMYGERPFSPITRVMGSSSSSVSTSGSNKTHPSRANSLGSVHTLGSSGVLRRGSGLVNELATDGSDDGSDEDHAFASASASVTTLANANLGMHGSAISSLSERYPVPPTPPLVISPPESSVGIMSAPSSPSSGGLDIVIHEDTVGEAASRSPSQPPSQILPSIPPLSLVPDASRPGSQAHSAASPALSFTSFLSLMPASRATSGSEADEFLSVASDEDEDDSDWSASASPVMSGPSRGRLPEVAAHNSFLDFEHLVHASGGGGSEHGGSGDGSEVLVSDMGHDEGRSEVGSDESWGSARRH